MNAHQIATKIMETALTQMHTDLNQLRAMWGARGQYDVLTTENGFQIKFKGSRKANCMRLTVTADLYNVEFYKGFNMVEVWDGMGVDDLRFHIEKFTGLRMSL